MHKISVADSHGRPLFAAGQAFVASTLDMLTIQSLQDPEELCFWHKVMGIEPVGSIMGHSFDGGIEEGGGDDDGGGGANSGQSPLKSQLQIQAIKVPIEFVGETYAHLFQLAKRAVSVETKSKLLASRGGLSGGSFRTPPGDSSRGPGDSGAGQESKGGCR